VPFRPARTPEQQHSSSKGSNRRRAARAPIRRAGAHDPSPHRPRPLYSLALATSTVASLQLQYVLSTGRWRLPAWLPARLAGSSSASAAGAGAERPPMSASSPLLSTGPASKTTAQHAEVPAAGGEGHVDPAAVDPFVASWGRFQWKIFGIAGGTGASFAGWILLPVFVDPMLQSWDGGVFTKGRTALLGSLFFAGWAVGAALSSPLADR
jgi:hypothetical protein